MTAHTRTRRYMAGTLAQLQTCEAELRSVGADAAADKTLEAYDMLAPVYLQAPLEISHTRRMRVPLPPEQLAIVGGDE